MKGELGENSHIKRLNCHRVSQWFVKLYRVLFISEDF